MKIKTSELTGAALDWAVAKCEGHSLPPFPGRSGVKQCWINVSPCGHDNFEPSIDWAQGGPIIEREALTVKMRHPNPRLWVSYNGWNHDPGFSASGPTPLIAAMRCYVASKLGGEIEVPEELVS